ncbi:MAG: hypothetical protein ACRDL0_01075 [Thermoleophilaceae bacterium]
MARYICPSCHEVVESAQMRFAFCSACGGPLTIEDLLPVQPIAGRSGGPKQPARPAAQGMGQAKTAPVPEVAG